MVGESDRGDCQDDDGKCCRNDRREAGADAGHYLESNEYRRDEREYCAGHRGIPETLERCWEAGWEDTSALERVELSVSVRRATGTFFLAGSLIGRMRIREWQDVLMDVTENDVDPTDWRAIAGDRASGVGEDMYLGHPQAGVFFLKTYAKNPYEVRGVGTRVARKIDDDLDPLFPDQKTTGRFAVQSPPEDEEEAETISEQLETVLESHSDGEPNPQELFEDLMDALESPAFGPMEYDQYDRPDGLDDLGGQFEEAEQLLEAELEELIDEDAVDRGFM